jgi:hypothetical protein
LRVVWARSRRSSAYGDWNESSSDGGGGDGGEDSMIGDAVVRKKQGRKYVEYAPKDNRDRYAMFATQAWCSRYCTLLT